MKIVKLLIILLVIFTNIKLVNCKELKNYKQLNNYIINYIKSKIQLKNDESININIKNLKNIKLPLKTENIFNPTQISKNGITLTFILKTNSKLIPIYVNYKILKKVIITNTTLYPNQEINYVNLEIKNMEKYKIPTNYINPNNIKDIINYKPKFIIKKNMILTYSMIKKPYMVKANSLVNLIIEKNNLKIETTARALSNGYNGQIIKIITKFNKVLTAQVIKENTVLIKL